ncbi:alpha/beta hydrolase [Streptomyces avicenniae]|uniref:alpha/beta hydrolase n=1 Tax=Streptomyces avicenniae TaxID=500153 RepID=UPI00069BE69E|nr:alpha/beta hydrolase [Streptomyces avicenniae]
MPAYFRELYDQDFSAIARAVTSWRRLADACLTAHETSASRVSAPLRQAGWEGEAARSGFEAMRVTQSMLLTANRNTLLLAGAMAHARLGMQAAQERLRAAVAEAEEAGHRVTASGGVEPRASSPAYRNLPEEDMALRDAEEVAALRQRIHGAIEDALEASGEAWRALRELDWFTLDKEYGAQSVQDATEWITDAIGIGVGGSEIPADDASPEEVAAWWSHVNGADQELLLASYPAELGALDGLPADIRDRANRTALTAQLDEFRMNESSLGIHDQRLYANLLRLQAALDDGAGAPRSERLHLLGFDPEGDGRAVVAQGDPDTADHTAVMVPGTGNHVGNLPGQLDRGADMQEAASERRRGDVAVVTWVGYDTPETISVSPGLRDRAEAGAGDLRDFTAGLRAASERPDGHLTVVGHSYGSTLVGVADSGGRGLQADDIVVVGSPGMGVDRAEDLRVDPDHVWVGVAPGDFVAEQLSGLTLGTAPQDSDFGARRMPVEPGGHSDYWRPGSQSLENIGRIIAGERPLSGGSSR